ncbi:hypothetical protein ACOMHN_061269 [Nucella lapillus]
MSSSNITIDNNNPAANERAAGGGRSVKQEGEGGRRRRGDGEREQEGEKEGGEGLDYDYLQCTIPDMHGIPRGRIVPRHLVPRVLKEGFGLFQGIGNFGLNMEVAKGLTEYVKSHFANATLLPDPSTARCLQWSSTPERRMGHVACTLLVGFLLKRGSRTLCQVRFVFRVPYQCDNTIGPRVGDRGLETAGWRPRVGDRGLGAASWGPDRWLTASWGPQATGGGILIVLPDLRRFLGLRQNIHRELLIVLLSLRLRIRSSRASV